MDAYTEKVVAQGFEEVKGYIDRSIDEVFKRLDELEAIKTEPPVHGKDGRDGVNGVDGKSVTLDDVRPVIEEAIIKAVAAIPPPKDGVPGRDGTDGKDGEKGLDGAPGKDGEPGRDGVDGKDGQPGKDGLDGAPGAKGLDGKDGVGLASALIDRDGELVVTMTDGRTMKLGRVNGHDGKDGKDGLDGLGFDDMEVTHDGERDFTLVFAKGERRKEFAFKMPVMIYRGIYKEGRDYVRGDVATWGGSAWHCEEDTTEKPGDGSKSWVLAVKEGRKGKDGAPGKPGDPGKSGPPGRDGYMHQL